MFYWDSVIHQFELSGPCALCDRYFLSPAHHSASRRNEQRLNVGDWNWCPDYEGAPRMFECATGITSEQVIAAIRPHLLPGRDL
jgi:hypothetical protein